MKFKIKIYYADTDCGGVVYYAKYLEYSERARTEWFESRGLNVRELAEQGLSFVVKDVAAEYISPARYGDTIIVDIKLVKIKAASLIFSYRITESCSGKELVSGSTKMAAVGNEINPVRITQYVRDRIKVDLA